ncbi:Hydroxypyruvate isomerase [Myxococcaceae bacterium]|nr:Hydroxypyruvate isomerase [Myxococcaceae bacterium]
MAKQLTVERSGPLEGAGLRYATHIGFRPGGTGLLRDIVSYEDPVEQVKAAAAMGFAAVQDAWALERDERQLNRIASQIQLAGLDGGCVVAAKREHLSLPMWVSADKDSREQQRLVTLHAIHVAELLSSEVIVVLPKRDPARPLAEQIDTFAENLRWTAELASRRDIRIGLEPMRVLPDMLIADLDTARQVVRRIDSGKAGIVFDTFHVHAENRSVGRSFVENFNDIVLLQIADHPGRREAGTGEIDIPGLIALARRMGFGGLVELEHDWSTADATAQLAELARLPGYEAAAQPAMALRH